MAETLEPRHWESLVDWATEGQREALEALIVHGSIEAAADSLGISAPRLRGRVGEIERRAARSGWSPDHDLKHPIPAGYFIKGVSTYYGVRRDEDGNALVGADGEVVQEQRGQWVKTQVDPDHKLAMLFDALQGIADPMRGLSDVVAAPTQADPDLMCVYPIGDPHIGMYSWAEETGADFDLVIAERNILRGMQLVTAAAPPAEVGVVALMGDNQHSDNLQNRTMRSGHPLDVDTRWPKVYRVGVRTWRAAIDIAKRRHKRVIVVVVVGNHDDHVAYTLKVVLDAFYENDPRVQVELSPAAHQYLVHGRCMLGFNHGHMSKPEQLKDDMSAQPEWSATRWRHYYCGHIHHERVIEKGGVVIEYVRTLAPRDANAAAVGYRSDRDLRCDVWHANRGLITRHIVGIEQVTA